MKKKLFVLILSLFTIVNVTIAQKDFVAYVDFLIGKTGSDDIALSFRGSYNKYYNEYLTIGVGSGVMGIHRTLTDGEVHTNISHLINDVYKDYSLEVPIFVNFRGRVPINKINIAPYYSFSFGYMLSLKPAAADFAIREYANSSSFHRVFRLNEFSKGLFYAPEVGISFGKTYVGIEYLFGLNNYQEVTTEYYYNNIYSSQDFYSEDSTINILSLKIVCYL